MYRFGLVGCGRVSGRHIDALRRHDDATLSAVCDVDPGALDAAARLTGAEPFRRLDAMLADAELDVVVLATPSGLHPDQAVACAQAGRHVVTEKPMAIRWHDGRRMVDACAAAGVEIFVVKQQRFSPPVQRLRQAVEAGRFGRIYSVHLDLAWRRPQSYYDLAEWRGTWEMDGGALMNQAIHYVDLLQWLIGPVESVHAFTATLDRRIEVEDTAAINLRWRSGALGTMSVTMLSPEANYEGALTVVGEGGIVRLGGVACNRIDAWQFTEPRPEDAGIVGHSPAPGDDSVWGQGHPAFYRHVLDALKAQGGDRTDVVDGREGLKSLEIVVAAYRSAQEGRRVSLPLEI